MKTLKSRVVILAVALVASVLLGVFLLRPGNPKAEGASIPWGTTALLVTSAGAVVWLRRRSLRAGQAAEGRLKCLEKVRLQPGKVLHLVEVDGVRLLVSSGENGVQLVTRIEEEKEEAAS